MPKLVKVKDLFDVSYGVNLELNALVQTESPESVNFVSRTGKNNGVSARVAPLPGVSPIPAGTISVAGGGSVMESFLQPEPYYSGRDLYFLTPRVSMTDEQKIYYCQCLRANKYRYSYGRQANRTLREISIPALEDIPDWVCPLPEELSSAKEAENKESAININAAEWKKFLMGEIFDIRKGTRLTKAQQRPGLTAYIGAIDSNNGLANRISQKAQHSAGTITVPYNGSVAEAFYQPEPYWASDDVNILYPKGVEFTPAIGLFLTTVIRREKYRFSYGRKWGLERMKVSEIRLPAKPTGDAKRPWEPDWDYMDRYIKTLPFSSRIE